MKGPSTDQSLSKRQTKLSFVLLALLLIAGPACGSFHSKLGANENSSAVIPPASDDEDGDDWWNNPTPTPSPTATPGSTPSPTPSPTPPPSPTPLPSLGFRVMTFNIKGIPCLGDNAVASIGSVLGLKRCPLVNDGFTRSTRERVAELIQRLQTLKAEGQEPDVILLQEAFTAENWIFDDSAVESIPGRSGYPYHAWGSPARIGEGIDDYWNLIFEKRSKIRGLLSSGLLILSKHPIEAVKRFEFGDVCTIDDCASNKGVLLTRIRVASLGLTMDIANTHQQAGVANASIRNIQSQLAASFIHGQRTGRVLFYGGDFNYRLPSQEPAASVIETVLQVQHAGRECKALGPELCEIPNSSNLDRVAGNSLDHIYFKGAEDTILSPVFVESPAWTFGGGLPLSDHLPIIAEF